MKKVTLLVLLAILASTVLMAAIPTAMLRLTIINKSGYDVYMKLTGSAVTEAFYYLTVPAGTRDTPTIKVFTVMSDMYTRETWQCEGVRTAGSLYMSSNIRLTFTPCWERACTKNIYHEWYWGCDKETHILMQNWYTVKRKAGEPTMEKVTAFRYNTVYANQVGWGNWWFLNYNKTYEKLGGYWNLGCGNWIYRVRTYRLPLGCAWRYQY